MLQRRQQANSSLPPNPPVDSAANLARGPNRVRVNRRAAPFANRFFLSTNNAITFLTPIVSGQKLTLTARSGLLRGQFNQPQNGNVATPVVGVVLQEENTGRGFFLGTNHSGSFLLQSD